MKIITITVIKCIYNSVHKNIMNILYYDRIGVSEGIEVPQKSVLFAAVGIF